jgi:hypothetical protein
MPPTRSRSGRSRVTAICSLGADAPRFGWQLSAWFLPVYHRAALPDRVVGTIAVPYLPLVLLSAALPGLRLRRTLRRRRSARLNVCPRCGYDLRATPGRCPECGRMAGAPAAA